MQAEFIDGKGKLDITFHSMEVLIMPESIVTAVASGVWVQVGRLAFG